MSKAVEGVTEKIEKNMPEKNLRAKVMLMLR